MKIIIDRTCARYAEISNKDFYFILSAADNSIPAMKRTVEEFRGFTSCLDKSNEKGIIYVIEAWSIGYMKRRRVMKEAFELAKSIN